MCKSSESGKHISQSRDWKASDVIGAQRICRRQSWWVSHSVAHPRDPLHIIFWGMYTMVALVWVTYLRAERKNIGTSNLFSYSVTVLPHVSISISKFVKNKKKKLAFVSHKTILLLLVHNDIEF